MLILRITLLVGALLTAYLVLLQVCGWRAGRSVLTRRQVVLRVWSGITLIFLLGLIFVGSLPKSVFVHISPRRLVLLTMSYASLVIGLSFLLLLLALMDIRESAVTLRNSRREARAKLEGKDGQDQ